MLTLRKLLAQAYAENLNPVEILQLLRLEGLGSLIERGLPELWNIQVLAAAELRAAKALAAADALSAPGKLDIVIHTAPPGPLRTRLQQLQQARIDPAVKALAADYANAFVSPQATDWEDVEWEEVD